VLSLVISDYTRMEPSIINYLKQAYPISWRRTASLIIAAMTLLLREESLFSWVTEESVEGVSLAAARLELSIPDGTESLTILTNCSSSHGLGKTRCTLASLMASHKPSKLLCPDSIIVYEDNYFLPLQAILLLS
jgi:hypothetical protein